MLKAFWTWDPVSSGTYRAFDEPLAYQDNKWFFDKSVWQKLFRAIAGCGFNAIVLANTHPFPFMVDLPEYPEARVIDDDRLRDYQRMHHWVFETALDYEIAPHLCFFNIYYPRGLAESRGIGPSEASKPTDFAIEYTRYCVREMLATYPELAGFFVDTADVAADSRAGFVQKTIVDALDAVRPDAALYLRASGDPNGLPSGVERRGGRPVRCSVRYTGDHIVDANPDPEFSRWVESVGAENVAAEIRPCNCQPWTSFSFEAAEGILENLTDLGCEGFSLLPLSPLGWPKSSDTYFRHQFQRDLLWYSIWGGATLEGLRNGGQPKWLLRNYRLVPGFQAGSRILELTALYFAADKSDRWLPQFCSVRDDDTSPPRLFTIEDMLHIDPPVILSSSKDAVASATPCPETTGHATSTPSKDILSPSKDAGHDWWTEITGDRVVHLAEYLQSGTQEDAYGPDELLEELADLSEQAVSAGEKGVRNASGEKELPSFARDALCMGRLGEFYVERIKAALAHARGDNAEALEHMSRALGLYREIRGVDNYHRTPFRVTAGRGAMSIDFLDTVKALEAEFADASAGNFKRGPDYPTGTTQPPTPR